jgi:hypothetical protein
MRNSVSEPTLKSKMNIIGNGYGQYCVLDDVSFNPPSKKIVRDKIKIKIRTPVTSSENLHLMESNPHNRHRLFIVGLYITTVVIIGLEYWFYFKT